MLTVDILYVRSSDLILSQLVGVEKNTETLCVVQS